MKQPARSCLVPRLLIVLLLPAAPLAAQDVPSVPADRLAVSGLLGGGVGWLTGALAVGVPLARANPFGSDRLDDGAWTPGFVIGFEGGQAVGIPLGVYRANGRQGNLRGALLSSLALGVAGTLLLWTDDFDAVFEKPSRQAILVTVPVAQLVTSIYFVRR